MRGHDTAGYSLLELLVVLAIIGLIATIAVPSVAVSLDRVTLTADARAVATRLRAWRNVALDQQAEIRIAADAGRLTASNGESFDLSQGTVADGAGAAELVISPVGASSGAIRLKRGQAAVTVAVDPITGRVSIVQNPP